MMSSILEKEYHPESMRDFLRATLNGMCMHAIVGDKRWLKGIGKTFTSVCLMHRALQELPDEVIVVTNIKFGHVVGWERDPQGNRHPVTRFEMPPGVIFVNEFVRLVHLVCRLRMDHRNRWKTILVVIDELPGWLSRLEASTNDAKVINKFLDLTRKFRLCLVGIGPDAENFLKKLENNVNIWWWRSLEEYRLINLWRQIPDDVKLSVQNHVIVEGSVPKHGQLFMPLLVMPNEWCPETPKVGDIIYESERTSSFNIMDELLDKIKRKHFFQIIAEETITESEMYEALYAFTGKLIYEDEQWKDDSEEGYLTTSSIKRAYITLRLLNELNTPISIKLKKTEDEKKEAPGDSWGTRRESILDRTLLAQLFRISTSTLDEYDRQMGLSVDQESAPSRITGSDGAASEEEEDDEEGMSWSDEDDDE